MNLQKIVFSKVLKFFYGLLLLPLCYSVFLSLVYVLQNIEYSNNLVTMFFLGSAGYLALHFLLYKPMRVYVFGHELMHVISAKLCGAKVGKIKVNKGSGMVNVSKVNTFIALSPYLIPIYSLFIILLWVITKNLFKFNIRIELFMFLLGFSLMFHLVLTLFAISVGQTDFQVAGWLFSLVVIFIINCLILMLLFIILLPTKVGYKEVLDNLINTTVQTYKITFIKLKEIIKYFFLKVKQWKH